MYKCMYGIVISIVTPLISEMTYIVSGEALNSTHSLTHSPPNLL